VRRAHFDALRPVCPVCHAAPVAIASAIREDGDGIVEGILTCTNRDCLREYPVIDGIPVLVGAIRAWAAANPLQFLLRDDLSPEVESLIGDLLGPGSAFDTTRQYAGIYAADHYGEGAAQRLLDRALGLSGDDVPDGPLIDVACAVGGTTFHLASRFGRMTLGIDLNFAMLRVAMQALRERRVRFAQRRVGIVYDRREIEVAAPSRELADFWCCDAAALPFADGTFAVAASLNAIDCVTSPRLAIEEIARMLDSRGVALIATPYDWSAGATAIESWLGGHSQRGEHRGASEPVLHDLLARHFEIIAEEARVPWRVRLHDRSAVEYALHLLAARRV
jgi:SAM-dependent methyltransferase/uncharacterized protein YbaR (Trm112 family)